MPPDPRVTIVPVYGLTLSVDSLQISPLRSRTLSELARELSPREGNEGGMDQSRLTMGHGLAGSLSKRGNGLRSCGLSERGKRLKVYRACK